MLEPHDLGRVKREEVIFTHARRVVEEMQIFIQKIKRDHGLQAKIDHSPIREWAAQFRSCSWHVDTSWEPSSAWTYQDRWIVVMRVCQEMDIFLRGSDSSFVTIPRAKNWADRIEKVVDLSYSIERLEAHRDELRGAIDPH